MIFFMIKLWDFTLVDINEGFYFCPYVFGLSWLFLNMFSSSNVKFTDAQLRESISYACKRLGIDKPYQQQEIALLSFLKGHDLIVALPTSTVNL